MAFDKYIHVSDDGFIRVLCILDTDIIKLDGLIFIIGRYLPTNLYRDGK